VIQFVDNIRSYQGKEDAQWCRVPELAAAVGVMRFDFLDIRHVSFTSALTR
jgi:hypothetical protein